MEGAAKQGGSQIYKERRKGWDIKIGLPRFTHPCWM